MATIQVFGTKKCAETRKAERWFKERGITIQSVDLKEKGMSPGEGARYRDRGLKFAAPTGPRIETMLVEDPLLLCTPVVRSGREATVGYRPEVWATWS